MALSLQTFDAFIDLGLDPARWLYNSILDYYYYYRITLETERMQGIL